MKKILSFVKYLFFIPFLVYAQNIGTGYGYHSIAVNSDGKVYTWGENIYGQLGNGNNTTSNIPVTVDASGALSGKTIIQSAFGRSHSVLLASDGTVYTIGRNTWGQLGNGNFGTNTNIPVAVVTSGALSGKTIIQVAAGQNHSLALTSEGKVYTWGDNFFGQLGNGNTTISSVPVAVDTSGVLSGKTIIQIASGIYHSIALASDGTIYAWGRNHLGQFGNGDPNMLFSNVPVAADMNGALAGRTIIQVAAGANHSLALSSDGKVYTWGENILGQLGNGNTTNSNIPVAVDTSGALSGKTIIKVDAGYGFSIALASDGTVYTCGDNFRGQLGNGNNTNSNVPVAVNNSGVLSGKTIVQVAAGDQHAIVLASDGYIFTWGWNLDGQLGNGSNLNSNVPVQVYQDSIGVLPVEVELNVPEQFELQQNYPNPFNPSTKISWQSPVGSHQVLKVFDVLGNEVATLVDEYREAGRYEVEFQSAVGNRQLASGIYYYRLQAGSFVETKKMILIK